MVEVNLGGIIYRLEGVRLLRKSNEPIKRVMRWWRLEIGLSHEPGDKRHGRSMTAAYGHIRGSYGDAEDGMAIDIYLGDDLASREIFWVKQIKPDTGELDERKLIVGCWTQAEAEALYLRHMPKRFLGSIEKGNLNSLAKYQKS